MSFYSWISKNILMSKSIKKIESMLSCQEVTCTKCFRFYIFLQSLYINFIRLSISVMLDALFIVIWSLKIFSLTNRVLSNWLTLDWLEHSTIQWEHILMKLLLCGTDLPKFYSENRYSYIFSYEDGIIFSFRDMHVQQTCGHWVASFTKCLPTSPFLLVTLRSISCSKSFMYSERLRLIIGLKLPIYPVGIVNFLRWLVSNDLYRMNKLIKYTFRYWHYK